MRTTDREQNRAKQVQLREIWGLNRRILTSLEQSGVEYHSLVSTIPTVDNNIWSSYPKLQGLIAQNLYQEEGKKSEDLFAPSNDWRRSRLLTVIEVLVFIFRPQFRVRATRNSANNGNPGSSIYCSNSYHETWSCSGVDSSQYWGGAIKWSSEHSISIVGLGKKRVRHEASKELRGSGPIVLRSVISFLASVPDRIRLWKAIKRGAESHYLFRALRRDFFRSVFGVPALQATILQHEFSRILSDLETSKVLIPYENQLWERVLAIECKKLRVQLIGVMHTTPRFWDLRYSYLDVFDYLQPDYYIDNGKGSRYLLVNSGVPSGRILAGPALRFGHLSKKISGEPKPEDIEAILVVLGGDRKFIREMVRNLQSFTLLQEKRTAFRPHPSEEAWFRRSFPNLLVDMSGLHSICSDYQLFIADPMSSLALELGHCRKKICIFLPPKALNQSPLYFYPEFDSYFWDESSLRQSIGSCETEIDASSILSLSSQRDIWQRVVAELSHV